MYEIIPLNDSRIGLFVCDGRFNLELSLFGIEDDKQLIIIQCNGNIDLWTVSCFMEKILKFSDLGYKKIVIDLNSVDYLGSGTGALSGLMKIDSECVISCNKTIKLDVLQVLGVSTFVSIKDDIQLAIESLLDNK